MNNIINYYYGMNIINIYKENDKYIFEFDNSKYYFVLYDRNKKDLNSLTNICGELKRRNILTNEFILNKYNSFITPYNDKLYILIKENIKEHKINFNDILYIQNSTTNITNDKNLIRNNYIELWKNKIDFYEKEFYSNNKYKIINDTLDYYIGLGENAITYLVNNNVNVNKIVLSHRRINKNCNSFEFYNPLNYIFDNRARDVADYIKNLFFYNEVSDDLISSFFKYINFDREEYILFISRMLYPTYYFDLVDEIIFSRKDEKELKLIIDKSNNYIFFLKKIIYYINYNLRMNIPIIEWIIKKHD